MELKQYNSVEDVTLADIFHVLDSWERGLISEKDAFCFAEKLYYLGDWGWPQYSRNNKRSTLISVLESLAMIYSQPTLKSDIPALKHFLQLGQNDLDEAWVFIDNYWDSIDWQKRIYK